MEAMDSLFVEACEGGGTPLDNVRNRTLLHTLWNRRESLLHLYVYSVRCQAKMFYV